MPHRRTTRERSLRTSRASVISAVVGATAGVTVVAVAATFSLTSKHLGAAPLTTPPLFPVSLVLANGTGKTSGQPDPTDTITVVYSEPLKESTLCSSWTTNLNRTGDTISVDVNKAAATNGDDTVTVDSATTTMTCSSGFHFGTIDLGAAGFCQSTTCVMNKSGITLTQTATQSTLTFTLGSSKGGNPGRVNTPMVATYTPDPALTDASGTSVGSNLAATPAVVQL